MSAIADLSAWVKDSLSKLKCPLYTIYVDFTKAFDSIDRSRLFAKLDDMAVSATFIKALWLIFKQNNFQVGEGRPKWAPEVKCGHPHHIKHGEGYDKNNDASF